MRQQLAKFDDFGHKPVLNYKGAESHQTCFGGFCSFAVKLLTLIMIYMTGKKILRMEDPNIISFDRPMS